MANEGETFDEPDYVKLIKALFPALLMIRQRNATYQRSRPPGTLVDEVVIHDTDSKTTEYENTVRYLANPTDGRMVSIHYIIGRDSGQILSMVPEEMRANHAEAHNDRSIGIELWRNEKQKTYTEWQYTALAQLVYELMRRYQIPRARVIGHGFFKKSKAGEPREFDWGRLDDELYRLNERVKEFDRRFAAF